MGEIPGPVGNVAPARERGASPLWKAAAAQRSASSVPVTALLDGVEGGEADRAKLQSTLRAMAPLGVVDATVIGTRADGLQELDIAGVRVAVRLNEPHAAGAKILLALATGAAPAVEPELSETGQLLATLDAGRAEAADGATAPPRDAAPLSSRPGDAAQIAPRLAQAVRESGLFYESHVAAWSDGRLPLAEVRREPQARLGDGAAARAVHSAADLPAEATPLLQRQLEALAQGVVRWNGDAWPGQPLDLSIEEEERGTAANAGTRRWKARLKLNLPELGEVDATVQLNAAGANVSLAAGADAVPALARARGALAEALAARGLKSPRVEVTGHV